MPDTLSRFLGCLLGGAAGDALGYPVEFLSESMIQEEYGDRGICRLSQCRPSALISDDTQMTLFTAGGLMHGLARRGRAKAEDLLKAYHEWLYTQGDASRMRDVNHPALWLTAVPALHSPRAPGITCLNALSSGWKGGSIERPLNHSKGCGGVMRVAPIGLMAKSAADAACLGGEAAALTHGHPLGYGSAALFTEIIWRIVSEIDGTDDVALPILAASERFVDQYPEAGEMRDRIAEIMPMAQNASLPDLEGIHRLGEGWVGEEALYIAIFCAVRYQHDFAAALRAAVNHRGDSDSTGAICGNLLGAWLGLEALEASFDLTGLELRPVIEETARDLYAFRFGKPDALLLAKYHSI